MRLRYVKGSEEALAASEFVIRDPKAQKGRWAEFFGEDKPIRLEIGMGRGKFLLAMAEQNPDVLFLGLEKYASVLVKAVEREEILRLPNLRFLYMKAEELTDVFAPEEIDRIYLNFSDPWPKDRHAKRRLTSTAFLERYTHILKKTGTVEFKTDNFGLYDSSLESLAEAGWILLAETRDLHSDPVLSKDNIMTEYEEKFSGRGQPIGKLIFKQP